jgi:hypothetical protein
MNFSSSYSYNGHPTLLVTSEFEVDQLIYPLLKVLWDRHLKTEYSCQGGDRIEDNDTHHAYILFHAEVASKWFAKLIEDNGYECYFSPREHQYGQGASVNFNPDLIEKLTELVSSAGSWDTFKFQQEVRAAATYIPKSTLSRMSVVKIGVEK